MERGTLCNAKYRVLNDFCYAEFLAYYILENKSNKTCECHLDELDDNLVENKKCSYPKKIKLMISGETMRCLKVRRILDLMFQINFYPQKNLLIMIAFIFSVQIWKRTVIRFSINLSKQIARVRNPECYKYKQNEIWATLLSLFWKCINFFIVIFIYLLFPTLPWWY